MMYSKLAKIEKVDIFIANNNYAFNTDFIKETSKSIYSEGMFGDIYRIGKQTKKVYCNGKYIGTAQYFCLDNFKMIK